jgi:hypothetical protein
MPGGGFGSGPRTKHGGVPGRSGADWRRCRTIVINRSGGVCALCRRPLVPSAKPPDPQSTVVDHYRTPWYRLREAFEAGTITETEFRLAANDPDGCRAVHRGCDQERMYGGASDPTETVPAPTPAPRVSIGFA